MANALDSVSINRLGLEPFPMSVIAFSAGKPFLQTTMNFSIYRSINQQIIGETASGTRFSEPFGYSKC